MVGVLETDSLGSMWYHVVGVLDTDSLGSRLGMMWSGYYRQPRKQVVSRGWGAGDSLGSRRLSSSLRKSWQRHNRREDEQLIMTDMDL